MRRNSDSLLIVQGSEEYNRLQKCKFTMSGLYIDAQMAPFNIEFKANHRARLKHQFETLSLTTGTLRSEMQHIICCMIEMNRNRSLTIIYAA